MVMNSKYVYIKPPKSYPGKLLQNRYAYEHHVAWWLATGEILDDGYVLHHRNGDHKDNRIGNLEKKKVSEHAFEHGKRPIRHGTLAGYRRGCRCEACSKKNKDYCKQKRLVG